MEKQPIPKTCFGVKCMIAGCSNLAAHKVGEQNIWFYADPDEREQSIAMNRRHELTTYLCKEHFDQLMTREEHYSREDPRFGPI